MSTHTQDNQPVKHDPRIPVGPKYPFHFTLSHKFTIIGPGSVVVEPCGSGCAVCRESTRIEEILQDIDSEA